MAYLTNFSLEIFKKFSEQTPLYFFYTMVQKSRENFKSSGGGGGPAKVQGPPVQIHYGVCMALVCWLFSVVYSIW